MPDPFDVLDSLYEQQQAKPADPFDVLDRQFGPTQEGVNRFVQQRAQQAAGRPSTPWHKEEWDFLDAAKERYPGIDVEALRPTFTEATRAAAQERAMGQAQERATGDESTSEFLLRRAIPYGSQALGFAEAENYKEASQRVQAGQGTERDFRTVAEYEARNKTEAQKGLGASVLSGAARLPTYLAPGGFPGWALEGASQRSAEQGGEWYEPKNLLPELTKAVVTEKIMGRAGKIGAVERATGGGALARAAVGAVQMPAEQQTADLAMSLTDNLLPEAYQLKTKYGLLGKVLRGEDGAAKDAMVQAITGAGFAAMHTPERDRKATFEQELRRQLNQPETAPPEAPAQAQEPAPAAPTTPQEPSSAPQMGQAPPQAPPEPPAASPSVGQIPKAVEQPAAQPAAEAPVPAAPATLSGPAPDFVKFYRDNLMKPKDSLKAAREAISKLHPDFAAELQRQFEGGAATPPHEPDVTGKADTEIIKGHADALEKQGQPDVAKALRDELKLLEPNLEKSHADLMESAQAEGRTRDEVQRSVSEALDSAHAAANAPGEGAAGAAPAGASPAVPAGERPALIDRLRAAQKDVVAKVRERESRPLVSEKGVPEEPEGFDKGRGAFASAVESADIPERDKQIAFRLRTGESLDAIAKDTGLTREGVRQVGNRVMEQVEPGKTVAGYNQEQIPGAAAGLEEKSQQTTPEDLGKRGGFLRLPAVDVGAGVEKLADYARQKMQGLRQMEGRGFTQVHDYSPEAADAMARSVKGVQYGKELGDRVLERVQARAEQQSGQRLLPGDELHYGKVFEEQRRQTAKKQLQAEALNALNQSLAAMRQGNKKEAQKLLKRGNRIWSDANDVKSRIGVDLTANDYQTALADPKYKALLDAWKAEGVPIGEEMLRKTMGLAPGTSIPNLTQIPDLPISVLPLSHASMPGGKRQGDLDISQRTGRAAKRAGLTTTDTNTNLFDMMRAHISERADPAAKAEALQKLQDSQVANRGKPGQRVEGWTEFKDVFQRDKTGKQRGVRDSLYVRDEVAKDVRKWFDVDQPAPTIFNKVFTGITLAGPREAFIHGANQMRAVFEPGWSPVDFAKNLAGKVMGSEKMKDKLLELTRIGAQKPEGQVAPKLLPDSPLNPMTWTRKALDFVNDVSRTTLDDAYSRLVRQGRMEDTESGRRNFINVALGQYERRMQHDLVRLARDTSFGPFAVAGTTGWLSRARALVGGSGGEATTTKAGIGLRAEKLARLLALPAAAMAINYLRWGKIDGDESVPFGAVKTGVDAQGRSEYIDLSGPLGAAARQFGVRGAADELRHEGTPGKAAGRGATDAAMAAVQPFLGPGAEFAHTAYTGRDHFGRPVAPSSEESPKEVQNLLSAALGLNPGTKAAEPWLREKFGAAKTEERKSATERAAEQLGSFRFQYSKGEGAQALSDVYNLRSQYLRAHGRPDDSAQHVSSIKSFRDAASADDLDNFRKAWDAYKAQAKAQGKTPGARDEALLESLNRLDPLSALNEQDRLRFKRGLTEEQKTKLKAAEDYTKELRQKIRSMLRQVR